MKELRHLVSVCAGAGLALSATPADAQNLYAVGRQAWRATQYPKAYPPLLQWRGQPYGRTADVDYMLGTSACPIPDKRQWGARALNYILYSYALTSESRTRVKSEETLCRSAGAMPAPTSVAGVETTIAAGATARGKMFDFGNDAVAAYPARQVREIPPAALQARLAPLGQPAAALASGRTLAGPGARVKAVSRYLFVTGAGQSDAELDTIASRLDRYLGFLESAYGITPPDRYLTLHLLPSIGEVQATARRVHGLDVSPSTLGYAYQEDLSAVAMIRGAQAGTLLHELFHLLVRRQFGDIPQWLDEGMAGLYEVSRWENGQQRGLPNWRGRVLQSRGMSTPSLEQVVRSPWFGFDMIGSGGRPSPVVSGAAIAPNLATARYFAMFLQDRNQLAPVFKALRARDPGGADDPAAEAVAIVEKTTGPMAALQADYQRWLGTVLDQDESRNPTTRGLTLPVR